MTFDVQRLYELVPDVNRQRDLEIAARIGSDSGPLRGVLSILAEQFAALEENLAQLYDDQFIETCAEWVVPYIGDLVGMRGIVPFPGARFTRRGEVANAIKDRRSKGTAFMLKQLARDVTRWDAHVVEYFHLLATTQFLNHLRPKNRVFPDLGYDTLARINTPFDEVPRTADVRNIGSGAGKYNIPNIGIFLWRIRSYPITQSQAFRVDANRWKADPLGRDLQLYNLRDDAVAIDDFATPVNVPDPIWRERAARKPDTYTPDSIELFVDDVKTPFHICDLRDVVDPITNIPSWAHTPVTAFAASIDPELGRIALRDPATSVRATYQYGFSADMGGGEYERGAAPADADTVMLHVPTPEFPTINDALTSLLGRWAAGEGFSRGIVELTVNDVFTEPLDLHVPKAKVVEIRAAEALRPLVVFNGTANVGGEEGAEFHLDGLLVAGTPLTVVKSGNAIQVVGIRHCTLVPDPIVPVRLVVAAADVTLELAESIIGAVEVCADAQANISNSIVDALGRQQPAYRGVDPGEAGGPLTIGNSTVVGTVFTRILQLASNTIFDASSTTQPPVQAEQVQKGCVRFSFVPPGSRVPRRYKCQPSRAGVRPLFTSGVLGQAAYMQLARNCAIEIRTGADDQSEMGAFHDLFQPQREANLRTRLDEFLRFGLEAGIFYAS